jgi:sulfur-carrier protein adenylyltransferase/sulfurtransferase
MSKSLQQLLDQQRAGISTVTPRQLAQESNCNFIIDVREEDELQAGIIPAATHIPRGVLELRIEAAVPDRSTSIVIYCAAGTRSALAAHSLMELGYRTVRSLEDGIKGWKDQGLPLLKISPRSSSRKQRYNAQTLLPQVGEAGQQKIEAAKVLLIGAGGLGSPAAYYLTAAGVGTLGIVDDDVVDTGNLQRQILHTTDRVGMPKVESAFLTLKALNPNVNVKTYGTRLTRDNVDVIFPEYDIVVDGCDNFQTRYLVNDACLKHKKTNIHGSIFGFQGQTSVFCAPNGPCYRCLFPEPPPPELAPNCTEAGVLGVLPGLIGLMEATETLKLILGAGFSLVGRLLLVDALKMEFRALNIQRDPACGFCNHPADIQYQDYTAFCSARSH